MVRDIAVLYVEDDPQSRRLMNMLLKNRLKMSNVTILEDSQSFEAKVRALDPKPELIFLDIHVKPYDGFQMLSILRTMDWSRDVPVVALTASVMNEEVQKLKSAGFNGCLAKPIDLDTFPVMMERILDGEVLWRIVS